MKNYTVYHLHSDLSNGITNIDSVTKYYEYIDYAKSLGMSAMAFSEHGSILEWVHKKTKIESAGMKYIHAEEFYLTENKDEKIRDNYHCVLIAKNFDGVKELNRLSSISFLRDGHFYYSPRITFDELMNTSDNIIVTSACFMKGNKVKTKHGLKNIENIISSDYVMNMFGEWEKVNYPTQINYNDDGYKIVFSNTKNEITCTKEHKFLVISNNNTQPKWVDAQNIAKNKSQCNKEIFLNPVCKTDYSNLKILNKNLWENSFIVPKKKLKTVIKDIIITPEFLRMIGIFIGDGHISLRKNPRVGFTLNYNEYNAHYKYLFEIIEKQLGIKFCTTIRENTCRVDITSSSVDFINLIYWLFGDTKANTKHIPKILKHISKESDMELLYGYFLSDGCIRKTITKGYISGRFVCATISNQLFNDLADLFDSLNLNYSFRTCKEHIDDKGVHHNKAYYIESNSKEYIKINKYKNVNHNDIVELLNNVIKHHCKYYITYNQVLYKKIYMRSINKIHINDTVYCLNNNSHSFVCEGVVVHNCLGGVLFKGNDKTKAKFLKFLIESKHRCYLEIQHHNDNAQAAYNKNLYEISQKYDIPLIAGTDTHALNERHLRGRSIMQKSKGVRFAEEDGWDLTFKTYDELIEAYKFQNSIPEKAYLQAIENTNIMAESVEEFKLDYSKKYPQLYDEPLAVLKQKIIEGIKKRGVDKYNNFDEYKKKIAYELKTYLHNEAVNFILLEEDYKTALKNQGVNYGYSRGSVSGSVIAYLLGITEVDSIKYNLNFDRFMNSERVSLADVDTDWFKEDRWRVRDYLFKKEGLHCCNIITFNTIKMKGAIKDVGRALGMTPEQTQSISDMVQEDDNKKEFVDERVRNQYPELFEYVGIVINTIVSLGRHAAGLVVSPTDVDTDFGTLYISSDDKPISQINMKEIDSLNYVKLDVLGLDCVGLIDKTCKSVGIPFLTPDNMDFNDNAVWEDIAKDTTLIFQFESDFAGDYLKEILKPQTIANIKKKNPNFSYIDLMSMANGAIRPAGASYRNELSQGIYRDNGNEALNEFLAPTLGFLVYQEQIIEFLHKFCGFTMGEADIVRRHFAKKTGTEDDIPIIKDGGYMNNSEHYIKGFIQTMYDNYSVPKENAEEIIVNFLKVIEDASSYLFSLNHAQPYSFLGFACGYLRHYYPLETLTAALNIYNSDKEKSASIKAYIKSKGFSIEPIKFGKSSSEYRYEKETGMIYQGIGAIKYCNSQIADELMELSKTHYSTFVDLLPDIKAKTSVDARQLKILTGLNFFREFGENKYLLNIIKVYDDFSSIKQIKKSQLEQLGLPEYLSKKYSNKETLALFKEINNIGLIKELVLTLENKPMGIIEYVKFENEYLEYITYTNESVDKDYYIIIDFMQGKDVTKPRFTARQIKTGKEIKSRIKKAKVFKENPFGLFSVLKISEFDKEFKRKPVNGEWVVTDEIEDILNNYEVIK